jgi:hypothetical protein
MFAIYKAPGDPVSPHSTREEAVEGIRELFEAGLAERGEFSIVERDAEGNVIGVFNVDDEIAPTTATGA